MRATAVPGRTCPRAPVTTLPSPLLFVLIAGALLVIGCAAAAPTVAPSSGSSTSVPPAATAVSPAGGAGCASLARGDQTIRLTADGHARDVLVHVPPLPSGAHDLPALVALHGYSSKAGEFAAYTGLSSRADEAAFLVAYPQALGATPEWHLTGWPSASPDLGRSDRELIGAVFDWLVATGCVDPTRMFLAGHSQGGGMTAEVACELEQRIAGIGLVSAIHLHLPCQPTRPFAVFASHAVDDPVLPFGGGQVQGTPATFPAVLAVEDVMDHWAAAIGCAEGPEQTTLADGAVRTAWSGCHAPVTFYRLPSGGHAWPDLARNDMWDFFVGLPPR